MNQPRITPKELRRRYRQGERDFRGVDLSGASLRGADLRGADLSEADLSRTDLRGVRFDGATLAQTTLSQSKTGARRHWMGLKLLVATGLFSLSSFLANIIYCYIAVFIFNPAGRNSLDTGTTANTIAGILGLVTVVAMVGIVFTRGLLHSLGVALCAVGGAVAVAILFAGVNAFFSIAFVGAGAVAFAVVVAVAGISSIAGVAAGMDTAALALAITGTAVGIGAVAATGAIAVFEAGSTAVALVTGLNIVTISVSILISHRALEGDHRDRLIRDIAVWFGSLGGTSFSHADLTDADCFQAVLKNACFDSASFVRTRLHLSRNLHLSRLSDTILSDLAVLHLLTSHRGNGQNYTGKSLKGANLAGADLADAIFTEADLSQADLTGASLSRATLIKTQALGTQFRQADLTGACIEAWNIDSTTQLEGVVCEYAYLLR
ncbi:MAG: pentapeptide repeat-containing protein, partial [Elainellaceae cyanobacterium]